MEKLKTLGSNGSARFYMFLMLMASSGSVFAQALPTMAPPSRGVTDGNYVKILQDYSYDILIFAGLLVSAVVFFVVSKNVVGTYSEIGHGKATWGEFSMHAGIGVLLLVLIVFFVTEASTIL